MKFLQTDAVWKSAAALATCLLLVACGKGTVHNVGGSGSSGRSTSGANATSESILRFGSDLGRHLGPEQPGNLAFSPASVATALTMTFAGARGETAAQMAKVLHVGADPNAVAEAFGELRAALGGRQRDGLTLETADSLWGQRDTTFRPGFVDLVGRHFGAALQSVDYKRDAEAARVSINAWVSAHTHGRIPELFAEGSLNDRTRLVLADAVYLLAQWASPFQASETETAPFHAPGHDVDARTMSQILTARYGSGSGTQAVELPYAGGSLVADVVLPEPDGLGSLLGD